MKLLFTIYLFFSTLFSSNAQIFLKHNATGTNNGTSQANAFTDLQDILDTTIPGDHVIIMSRTQFSINTSRYRGSRIPSN